MLRAVADRDLDQILSRVSRSFYLSLAVLPDAVREQLSVAYLIARAADTIVDTDAVRPERRRELVAGLREVIADGEGAAALAEAVRREVLGAGRQAESERLLAARLEDCLTRLALLSIGDRARTRRVLDALLDGMERDLDRFEGAAGGPEGDGGSGGGGGGGGGGGADGHHVTALETLDDLDEHCYLAAGCVGEYWTEMLAAHVRAARHLGTPDHVERGVRLGKALQLVNVLRDAPSDLAAGRCYLPESMLRGHGLEPRDLRDPARRHLALPVVDALRELALGHIDAAWGYIKAIPATAPRLRLAVLWPMWIGLGTLAMLAAARDPLDPARVIKVPRRQVYRMVAESAAVVSIDPLLERAHRRRRAQAA